MTMIGYDNRILSGPVRHLSLEPLAFDGVWSPTIETIDNAEKISVRIAFFMNLNRRVDSQARADL